MTNLQKQTIKHIYQILNNIDTYEIYKKLSETLNEFKLNSETENKILIDWQTINSEIVVQPIKDVKIWIEALLVDCE
jgi:hypothetical protein